MSRERDRWLRIEEILDRALDHPDEEREALVRGLSGKDTDLAEEVLGLLDAGATDDGFLDRGSYDDARALIEEDLGRPDREIAAGERIGHYEITRRLGGGGMGDVYLARDVRLDRDVALKLLPPRWGADEEAVRRFVDEARAASGLDHRSITTIYEIDRSGGRLYIAMAYHPGETLRDRIARGPLAIDDAINVAQQVAAGLHAAHEKGVVHRDIKPANIIVGGDGAAKIVDFGIAKMLGSADLTRTGASLGTVAYMSPEQTSAAAVDRRTDIWSLGVVLYEMVVGQRPFAATNPQATIYAIRNDAPAPSSARPADLPDGLVRVIDRCLEKAPDDRFRTAEELRTALAELAGDAAPPGYRRTRRVLIGAGGAVALLAAAYFGRFGSRAVAPPSAVEETAAIIAVTPFVSAVRDTALARLGRELVVTLSANLDGVGGLRTTDALTILARTKTPGATLEEHASLARELGARAVLDGSLLRAGAGVRLDARLHDVETLEPIATARTEGDPEAISALTDSLTLGILRQIWRRGDLPAPSLAGVMTASVPALTAYLRGEEALLVSEFREAVRAFEEAFAADSTFWFAYWRSLYPRIYEGTQPDDAVVAELWAHRSELPAAARDHVEARFGTSSIRANASALTALVERFPDYWPGLYELANLQTHQMPLLGGSFEEARLAWDQVVTLHPQFKPAREHRFWIAVHQHDTATARQDLAAMESVSSPTAFKFDDDQMAYYRAMLQGAVTADEPDPEWVERQMPYIRTLRVPPEQLGRGLVEARLPKTQIALARAIRRASPGAELESAMVRGEIPSWAMRGAWDSVGVRADEWVRMGVDADAPVSAYRWLVLGAVLGGIDPEAARRSRPSDAELGAASPEEAAELAWLDGIVAHLEGRSDDVSAARDRVLASGDRAADVLARSLAAFTQATSGDVAAAADSLFEIEIELADRFAYRALGTAHPAVTTVDRWSASRWLLAAGDTARAGTLLTFTESVLWGPYGRMEMSHVAAEPLTLFLRARIAESRGRPAAARDYYRRFIRLYDLPPDAHAAMIEQAVAGLRRLESR